MTDSSAKGLDGIIVGDTELSLVDGNLGKLIYRGYNIDEIAMCRFEQICHLFLYGRLPDEAEERLLHEKLSERYVVPNEILNFISANACKDHPMATLRTAVSMISTFKKEPSLTNKDELNECAIDLIAKTGTIVAAIGRSRKKCSLVEPNKSLSFARNFLYMLNGEKPLEIATKTLDTALVLHIDHGFNASTFTARVVTSSLSDMISAVTAAIGSLKGVLHGGANTAVMKMLMEIGSVENVEQWVTKALSEKRKIMGFGHRVYKVVDPRAKHLKKMSKEWGERAGDNHWFLMSEKIENMMMKQKGIAANVDFYSATTYFAMGLEPDMYTPIFAVARMVGWTAHVIEQLKDNRIMRPLANYIGPENKKLAR